MSKTTFTVHKDKLEVVIEREFNAPREFIWKVVTDPEMVPKWWGPSKYETKVDKMDFRVGGEWRFLNIDKDGNAFAFHGVYKEIMPNEKVVDTFNFEPIGPGHELTETMRLTDNGNGKTKMSTTTAYPNIQDLEGMVNSGMEGGATETYERIAALVENK